MKDVGFTDISLEMTAPYTHFVRVRQCTCDCSAPLNYFIEMRNTLLWILLITLDTSMATPVHRQQGIHTETSGVLLSSKQPV